MLLGPKCKYCRRFSQKIGLNERCLSSKCALSRRRFRPGFHAYKPRVLSLYAKQLLEKQKVKISYLINETKMKKYIDLAKKSKKPAAESLIELLERRLDNVIWRAGYVPAKTTARQLVAHGHFLVNGKRTKSPSYLVKEGDVITLRPQSLKIKNFSDLAQRLKFYKPPSWLTIDPNNFETKILKLPSASEISHNLNLDLVIDFYSRQ